MTTASSGNGPIVVNDTTDPRLEVFLGLRDRALRQRREAAGGDMAGVFMAEGDLVIERALHAGLELVSVLVDQRRTTPLPGSVPDDVPVFAAGPDLLQEVSGFSSYRGALACFARPPATDVAALLADPATRTVAVTEGVNNPNNMGLILRNGAGLGVDALLADASSCDPLSRRSCRVSMGQVFAVPHGRVEALPHGLDMMHAAGFTTLALTPSADAEDLDEVEVAAGESIALVLGPEGPGLSEETLAACHRRVAIRMDRSVDSLNVGAAAAVVFHQIRRARRQA